MTITSTVFPREISESVFADTFYWIALADSTDAAHQRARQIADDIVRTDEVLSEHLTFFCAAPEFMRREVALAVGDILQDPSCHRWQFGVWFVTLERKGLVHGNLTH